jgi:uncharacterized protein YkwD
MRLSLQFLFLLLFNNQTIITIVAQTTWDDETLKKANTAKDISYLTNEEKLTVFYCNLARLNPSLFANTYAKKYIDSIGKNDAYTKSLLKTLKATKSMQALYPSQQLFEFAKEHANDFGKKGKIGHGNFKKRFSKYMSECTCNIAENCDYGSDKALTIVMDLLIDENISDLGHRKNILNPEYKNFGVSIHEHKKFEWNCVMDFGSAQKIN